MSRDLRFPSAGWDEDRRKRAKFHRPGMAEGFWVEEAEVPLGSLMLPGAAEERIVERLREGSRSLRCGEVVGSLES
jgi:hypothetical protein